MASYIVPATADERMKDFNAMIEEFKTEYALVVEKQKKVSGYRARKALLSIGKLTRFIRKDIQELLATMSKTKTEETKVEEETKEQPKVEEPKVEEGEPIGISNELAVDKIIVPVETPATEEPKVEPEAPVAN